MFKKVFLILGLCLVASVILAVEKTDYKKFMEDYAKAYNSMDNKKLSDCVSKAFLSKLQWEFHKFRKAHKKPQLTLTDIVVKDNSISCKAKLTVGGKVKYKDQTMSFVLKDGKIQSVSKQRMVAKRKNNVRDFWSAVSCSDKIAVLESKDKGKKLKVLSFLPDEKYSGEIKFPFWLNRQVRKPGLYLLPLKKNENDYVVVNRSYYIPEIKANEVSNLDKLFTEYKKLKPEVETAFLKKMLQNDTAINLRYPALRHLAVAGVFKKNMSKADYDFWYRVFNDKKNTDYFRQGLFFMLARNNFKADEKLFIEALKDKKFSRMTASLYYRHDKKEFESMMLKWLDDPKLREFAVCNSGLLAKNKEFVVRAMKYFDAKDEKSYRDFVPILCSADNKDGNKIISKLLTTPENKKTVGMQSYTIMWISRINPTGFTKELKTFLKNNEDKKHFTNNPAYLTAVVCLCCANDSMGYKLVLKHIAEVELKTKGKGNKMPYGMGIFPGDRNLLRALSLYNPKLRTLEQFKKEFELKLAESNKKDNKK